MILDSNIIIYAIQNANSELRQFIDGFTPAVSVVSLIEMLGYHRLNSETREGLERFFQNVEILPLSDDVIMTAVRLRQQRRMGLADAIIAATALVHDRTLITHNTRDFIRIDGLRLHDPVE